MCICDSLFWIRTARNFFLGDKILAYHLFSSHCMKTYFPWLILILISKFTFNRVKLIIEEIEREELAWREDLYSSDRKFAEYYNVSSILLYFLPWLIPLHFTWKFFWRSKVLEQILGMLIKLVKDVKLRHQHKYVSLKYIFASLFCTHKHSLLDFLKKFANNVVFHRMNYIRFGYAKDVRPWVLN